MRNVDKVEVRNNLSLTLRERGKIVSRREGHNIWLNLGREYLAQLISYSSFGPPTTYRNDRVQYMGLGIGGTRQLIPPVANTPPLVGDYPGTNVQTDTDPTLTTLERPVRLSGSSTSPPYSVSDLWLGQVQAPPTFATNTEVTFRRLFTQVEISYGPYLTVPLSEIMLYTSAANPNVYNNTGIAYDTFDSISKTNAFDLEVAWTVRF
jgi:hypothetical protein